MKCFATRLLAGVLSLSLLHVSPALAARDAAIVRVYVNDTCIVADEPYFVPTVTVGDATEQPKFLPLIGLVIGKLAELFINHEIQNRADQIKKRAARKDTRYAITRQMNLYRADFVPAPAIAINAKLGCMTIVAAKFKPDGEDCTAAYLPKGVAPDSAKLPPEQWRTSRTDDSVANQLRRADICAEAVLAVYEARFEFSSDGTAYRLRDAGYRVDSLLTTTTKGAARTVLYTLKISNPGATDQQETLSSAWVKLGSVTAGSRSSGAASDAPPWLRVPPLSTEARRIYEDRTKVQQDVTAEINALRRAMTRNQRILAGLDARIAATSTELVSGMKDERTRIAVQNESQAAELDARIAEYQDLPRTPLEFMPVTIEVGVTESESEKKAQLALADIIGKNGDVVASAVGNATSEFISRSVDVKDLKLESAADPAHLMDQARARYFDALVQAKTAAASNHAESQHLLLIEKDAYNVTRRNIGLEEIQ